MEDINRRERNVIVMGLPERQDVSDAELFSSFCEVILTNNGGGTTNFEAKCANIRKTVGDTSKVTIYD